MNDKKSYTKIALTFSICLLILWGLLGTGTTLAWFTHSTPVQKNTFLVSDLDLVVSYKTQDGTYQEVTTETKVFDEEALYEPGYVQIIYFKIENKGDISFDYKTAVMVNDFTPATNVFGQTFNLQDYLRYGVVFANKEDDLTNQLATRSQAKQIAITNLGTYTSQIDTLEVNEEKYFALIVGMPEEVGNVANYRGSAPEVRMGINVTASQEGTLD